MATKQKRSIRDFYETKGENRFYISVKYKLAGRGLLARPEHPIPDFRLHLFMSCVEFALILVQQKKKWSHMKSVEIPL
jgi:hypothetical protein